MDSLHSVPRHAAIAQALRDGIRSGAIAAGSPLPSESRLSSRYQVSRGTVRQALASLRAEGLIVGGRGRAPVVRRPDLSQSFDQLLSFSAWARQLGRTPSARTLELARRRAGAEAAEQLGLEDGTWVFEYTRLRLLDGEPVMIERTTLLESAGRLLLDCDLDGGSVYEQLGERGIEFSEAHQTIAAIAASAQDAALLSVQRRAPILEVRRRALDPVGRPLEWSRDRYRGDAFAITIHNQSALPRAGVALQAAEGLQAAGSSP
ncbi:MAG: GntR family transcriptional regulator [Solirubrobacterales bacterium]|nr:GntR family transcriptional regulator [Solirubrobacterales bacterium]